MKETDILLRYEPESAATPAIKHLRVRVRKLALDVARGLTDSVHRNTATDLLWDVCRSVEKGLAAHGGDIPAGEAEVVVDDALNDLTKKELETRFASLLKDQQIAALAYATAHEG